MTRDTLMELLTVLLTPSFIEMVVTVLVGLLTAPAFQLVKRGWSLVDRLPFWYKPVLVVVTSFLLTKAAAALGAPLSTDKVGALTATDISALLSAAVAMALHTVRKRIKERDAAALTDGNP